MNFPRIPLSRALFPIVALALGAALVANPAGARPGFGQLIHEGEVVRTVVPPARLPHEGRDALYAIPGGTADQLPVIGTAPGETDYHGGEWAFHLVEWNTTPYMLYSEDEVRAAEMAGDVTVTRVRENDFRCPVQP